MAYRCVATSVAGFVQQLAVGYVARGYYFYVTGRIPEHKDPVHTDEKIIAQYGIGVSKWVRARRKRQGLANVHYLRYGTFFVIIASHGRSGVSRWMWGSVADRILRAACVPVLMVRAPGCGPGVA